MGVSTDEGITRGELREELHALEQRLDTRFNARFNDINDALEKVNKALDVLLANAGDDGGPVGDDQGSQTEERK